MRAHGSRISVAAATGEAPAAKAPLASAAGEPPAEAGREPLAPAGSEPPASAGIAPPAEAGGATAAGMSLPAAEMPLASVGGMTRDAGAATAAPADRSVSDDTSEMDLSTQGERQDRRAASKRKLERKASPPPAGAAPPLPIPTQPPDAAHKKLRSPRRE